MRGTSPLRKRGSVSAEHSFIHLVKEDSEESGGLIGRVWLEQRVNLDDEGGSGGREQTGLRPKSVHAHPSDVYYLRISVSCSSPRCTSS